MVYYAQQYNIQVKGKILLGILSSIRDHRKKSRETRESPTPADILVNN